METLPKILLIKPPPIFLHYETEFSRHFHFLKAYESHLPLPSFLSAANSAGVSALFVTANGPDIDAETVLDHIPSLKCIVSSAVGVNYIDLEECWLRGISVANGSHVNDVDCAEFAVGLLIDVLRKGSVGERFVRGGGWSGYGGSEFGLGRRLGGKKVGIIGLGNIGSKISKRLEAFNCHILYTSRNKKPSIPYTFYPTIIELATNSNVLIICCSLSNQTRHIINNDVLTALGKDGIVINIARGPIIDEKELVKFLLEGKIAGAGLDVFEDEPNVPKELLGLDNVVVTYHQAAFSEEWFRDLFVLVKGNFDAFFSNQPLLSPVV